MEVGGRWEGWEGEEVGSVGGSGREVGGGDGAATTTGEHVWRRRTCRERVDDDACDAVAPRQVDKGGEGDVESEGGGVGGGNDPEEGRRVDELH